MKGKWGKGLWLKGWRSPKGSNTGKKRRKKYLLRNSQRYFHSTESTKEKILKANPNLERNITIHQSIERCLLHNKANFKLLLIIFLQRNETLIWCFKLQYSSYSIFKGTSIVYRKLYDMMPEFVFYDQIHIYTPMKYINKTL